MSENNQKEDQEDRAFLREKFLRFISNMNKTKCQFVMHENVKVQGILRAVDSDFQNIVVDDLQTPYLPVENAILRSDDVISMHFNDVPTDLLHL